MNKIKINFATAYLKVACTNVAKKIKQKCVPCSLWPSVSLPGDHLRKNSGLKSHHLQFSTQIHLKV